MKIVSFVVCDDIRNESGGKHSLMGVYGNLIEFRVTPEKKNQWPKAMKIGIFITIKPDDFDREKNTNSFHLRINYNGEELNIAEGVFDLSHIPPSQVINLAILHNSFPFKEPGEIRFFLDFSDVNKDILETIDLGYTLKITEKISQ